MLNKASLSIASLVSNETSRFTLNGILVTPTKTVETDGHQLIVVESSPNQDNSAASFPEIPGIGKAMADFEPFLLPKKDAIEIMRAIPKSGLPALGHAAVVEVDEDFVKIVTTDLETTRVFPIRKLKGNFPDYERILPKLERSEFVTNYDPALLARTLNQVKDFIGGAVNNRGCRLHFTGPNEALRIEAINESEQRLTAVVMPMRDDAKKCTLYDQRKSAWDILVRFKADIDARWQQTEHQTIPPDSLFVSYGAALYGTVAELLADKPVKADKPVVEAEAEAEEEAEEETRLTPAAAVLSRYWIKDGKVYDEDAVIARIEGSKLQFRKGFLGDREQVTAWAERASKLEEAAAEPLATVAPVAPIAVQKRDNLIVMGGPVAGRPANWDELSPARKAWVTRRQKAAGITVDETPKVKGVSPKRQQAQELQNALAAFQDVLRKMGASLPEVKESTIA